MGILNAAELIAGGFDEALAGRNLAFGRLNFTRANLPKTANRLNRVAANATNTQSGYQFNGCRIDTLGDSLTRSPSDLYPSSGNQGGGQQRAWHIAMAAELRAAGFAANTDSINGLAIYTNVSGFSSNNGLISIPESWTILNQETLGGYFLDIGSGNTDAATITPVNAYDRVEVEVYVNPANGHDGKLTVTAGGDTSAEVGGGFGETYRFTMSLPPKAAGTPYTIRRSSGTGIYLLGIRSYLSTQAEVMISNCGRNSGTSTTLVGNGATYSPLAMIAKREPHLVIEAMGVNDWNPPNSGTVTPVTPLATFVSNTQTLINAVKAVGADMILVAPPQSNPAGSGISSAEVQAQYVAAKRALAISNNLPFIDFTALWGGFTVACQREMMARIDNGSGGTMFDNKHMSMYGAQNMGRTIGRAILDAVQG